MTENENTLCAALHHEQMAVYWLERRAEKADIRIHSLRSRIRRVETIALITHIGIVILAVMVLAK